MTLGTVYNSAKKDLQSLAQWTQDQFTQLAGSIAAGWNVQHTAEGAHGNVTATSVRANRLSLGKQVVVPLTYATASSKTLLGSGLNRVTFNSIIVPDDAGIVILQPDDNASVDPAIDAGYCVGSLVYASGALPQNGDLIWIGQHASSVFPIQLLNLASTGTANAKFVIPPKMQDPDATFAGTFTMSGSPGLVPFTYLAAPIAYRGSSATSTVLGAWTIWQTVSSRTSPL